jgi:hypothetical protein
MDGQKNGNRVLNQQRTSLRTWISLYLRERRKCVSAISKFLKQLAVEYAF